MPRTVAPVVAPDALADFAQPTLDADGLQLRPWRESDADAVLQAFAAPDIQRWHLHRIDGRAEAVDWIRSWQQRWGEGGDASWAMAASPTEAAIGYVSLRAFLVEGNAEVSYWVTPGARGRSVAARAVGALSEWAFDVVGLHRLWLMHSTVNQPSCAVATRAGFLAEGVMREHLQHADGWHDMHVHGRLKTDDPGGRAALRR